MNQKKVLIVDDDQQIAELVEMTLAREGYAVIRTRNGLLGLELARVERPDLVITDIIMPGMDGLTLCRELRKDKHLRLVPIIMLTGSRTHPDDMIQGLKIGADDYILKPFIPQELLIRVSRLIRRTEEHLSVNPLTKLPGTYTLEKEVSKRIDQAIPFAACYFDLDNFKAFNDHYSYQWGDKVIKLLAGLLTKAIHDIGNENDVLAHIGGDDFIVLTSSDKVEPIYRFVSQYFSQDIQKYYSDIDKARGFITTYNRKGEKEDFPLISISAAAASSENRELSHYAQVVDILSELKKFAKSKPGNVLIHDRRQL